MTYTKKQVLPALHHSNKVNNPDMPSVEDKNYTATILKYANLALPFPQLDTDEKTIVAAINELYAHPGGSIVIPNPPLSDGNIELEQGGNIELEQGGILETQQGGGGSVVGDLHSISIDGDIYTIEGGGETYTAGKLINISSENVIGVNMTKSTPEDIEQESRDDPNTLFYTEGTAGIVVATATLTVNGWNSSTKQQVATVSGVTGSNNVLVSPVSDTSSNYDNYTSAGVRAVAQGANTITFQCTTLPDNALTVCVGYWG